MMYESSATEKEILDKFSDSDQLAEHCTKQHMRKIEQIKYLANLPETSKRRIRALKKLQLDTTFLEAEFHAKVYGLEKEYEEKHHVVFEKRRDIVCGSHEPNDEECKISDTLDALSELTASTGALAIQNESQELGLPGFWLKVLRASFDSMIKEQDEAVLQHLTDIRVTTEPDPDNLFFTIEFHFSPNVFFSNLVLTKTYFLKCSPDPADPFSFDGPEIFKSEGCEINWSDGKDLTKKVVKRKNLETVRVQNTSFFSFFSPPQLPEDDNDPNFDDINATLEHDFEIGHYLKERVIPRAVLYFTGENEDLSENSSDNDDSDEDEVVTVEEYFDRGEN